jgi:Arm domain-containing DNA-binding protein
MLAAR